MNRKRLLKLYTKADDLRILLSEKPTASFESVDNHLNNIYRGLIELCTILRDIEKEGGESVVELEKKVRKP